jgi:glycosyltransferase involved in cell wall biosynthesis
VRILHVVTLVTPDGTFGGVVRVAFNLAAELQSRGHEVIVAGSTRGYKPIPNALNGVRVKLWHGRKIMPFGGHLGITAPALFLWLWRSRHDIDIVHVHMGRDMVTLPAAVLALLMRKRVVLQTHGMVVDSHHWFAPLLDRILTRPVLRLADYVLFLNEAERSGLTRVCQRARLQQLPNGVPRPPDPLRELNAHDAPEFLYLARLHENKRPKLFVEAAGVLLAQGLSASFSLVGTDQGEGDAVRRGIAALGEHAGNVRWEGALPLDATLDRMRRASVYVLPSVYDPFPMAVLEAMSVGLPVIVTESCGVAEIVATRGCGIVVDKTQNSLVEAMRDLLVDPALRMRMSRAATAAADELCSMAAIGNKLLDVYQRCGLRPSEAEKVETR